MSADSRHTSAAGLYGEGRPVKSGNVVNFPASERSGGGEFALKYIIISTSASTLHAQEVRFYCPGPRYRGGTVEVVL